MTFKHNSFVHRAATQWQQALSSSCASNARWASHLDGLRHHLTVRERCAGKYRKYISPPPVSPLPPTDLIQYAAISS